MVSYLPPLYSLPIYNRSFFDYQDGSGDLASTDARYLKKAIADTTTSSSLSLSSGTLNVGNATTTANNTINGVLITLASVASSGNIIMNRPINANYTPSNGLTSIMGYSAQVVGATRTLVSNTANSLRNTNLAIGNWLLCVSILLTCASAGTITAGAYGFSSSSASLVSLVGGATQTFNGTQTYVLNETSTYTICVPYQQLVAGNVFLIGQMTFASGGFNLIATTNIMRLS